MARRGCETGLAVALMAMLWVQSSAQTACTPAIVSLSPCLGFITGNSSSAPTSSCCTQLASVVQTQARCLCLVLNGGAAQLGINVNQTQAMTLPGACKIRTPPLSQCNAAIGAPAASPEGAPAPAAPATQSSPSALTPAESSTPSVPSDSSPSTPSVPSGSSPATPTTPAAQSGSKTVPTAGQSSAAGSSSKFTPSLVFFLIVAAYASSISGF